MVKYYWSKYNTLSSQEFVDIRTNLDFEEPYPLYMALGPDDRNVSIITGINNLMNQNYPGEYARVSTANDRFGMRNGTITPLGTTYDLMTTVDSVLIGKRYIQFTTTANNVFDVMIKGYNGYNSTTNMYLSIKKATLNPNIIYNKGTLVQSDIIAEDGTYPVSGRHTDGYWYEREVVANTPPNKPTITVPTIQFEIGDKHYISYNSEDIDGDALTFTLDASYDNEVTWSELYSGPLKTYQYTVPSGKSQVKFRVKVTDGKEVSQYTISESKTIREIYYYWSRFANVSSPYVTYGSEYYLTVTTDALDASVSYIMIDGTKYDFKGVSYESYVTPGRGYTSVSWGGSRYIGQNFVSSGYTSSTYYMPFTHSLSTHKGTIEYTGYVVYEGGSNGGYRTFSHYVREKSGVSYSDSKGSLITNTVQAGYNAYNIGVKNSDGYWYERGQRVLSSDTTPPVIELTEQSAYGTTSEVTVKVYDLSTVSKIKYSEGEQTIDYFTSNGTDILSAKKFAATKNGKHTVFAEDSNGNKAVQIINVYKVNIIPTMQLKTLSDVNINDNSNIIITDPYNGYSFKLIADDKDQTDNISYSILINNSNFINDTLIEKLKAETITIPQDKIGSSSSLITVKIKDSKNISIQKNFNIINKAPKSHSNRHVYEHVIELM